MTRLCPSEPAICSNPSPAPLPLVSALPFLTDSMYADDFDGQGSGHDFSGTLWMPPTGWVNNCDGGRAKTYCDYHTE